MRIPLGAMSNLPHPSPYLPYTFQYLPYMSLAVPEPVESESVETIVPLLMFPLLSPRLPFFHPTYTLKFKYVLNSSHSFFHPSAICSNSAFPTPMAKHPLTSPFTIASVFPHVMSP